MMMIRKRAPSGERPSCVFEIGEETLRPRDPGKRERGTIGRRTREATGECESRLRQDRTKVLFHLLRRLVVEGFSPVLNQQRIRRCGDIERLAKTAERKRPWILGCLRRDEQIDIAHQIEMLKPVIQYVHGASEPALSNPPCEISAR